jgi:short subunit dehydrogenase-like uncharacterized protein
MKPILIYGSYGYSGNLIVQECAAKKIPMILAGRDGSKLEVQARAFNVPFEALDLSETEKLKPLLARCSLVIHCAGPFRTTAKPMAKACLETKTHYTDITGEIGVFESLFKLNQQATDAGIMILPGTGFDVVPTDCMAARLKMKLPSATHLQLAFASLGGGPSRGTAKTAVEGLGFGSVIRKNGELKREPLGRKMMVDFGFKTLSTMGIPWGDVSTAFRTTGIPNIEVYMAVPPKVIRMAKLSNYFGWLLRMNWLKGMILNRMDKTVQGPADEIREKSRSYVWGKVWDNKGNEATAKLETLGGYTLTAKAATLIAEKILSGNFKPGFATAAMAYGADLVSEVEGSTWT